MRRGWRPLRRRRVRDRERSGSHAVAKLRVSAAKRRAFQVQPGELIAHRLGTIMNAVRGGRIVQEGTYIERMKQEGVFAEFVERHSSARS